jgi:hypothetical protein
MDFVLILLILHSVFYIYIYQYVYPKLRILHHMLLGLSEGTHGCLYKAYVREQRKSQKEASILQTTLFCLPQRSLFLRLLYLSLHFLVTPDSFIQSCTSPVLGSWQGIVKLESKLTIVYSSVIRLRRFRNGWTRRTSCSNSDSSTYKVF